MIELAIVIPTYNERENVPLLLSLLDKALAGIRYEVIFVDDDSPDGTSPLVRTLSAQDPRVRLLRRIHRRGLSSACLEGMLATSAPYIAVMDADLQHDETRLPTMLAELRANNLDIVVASRYIPGGSLGEFSRRRQILSALGRKLSASISHCDLQDPMSGFFLLNARFLDEVVRSVSGLGFKILLDLIASSRRPVRLAEIPYQFRQRAHGASKLDILVVIEYVQLLLDKTIGDYIPPKYVLFSLVGAVGVVLYLSLFWILLYRFGLAFGTAQAIATFATMTVNFVLNNNVTYRERRLRGLQILPGLLSFYAACSIGAIITVRLASLATNAGASWWLGGLCGLAVSSVWNYAVTRLLTWRSRRLKAFER